MKKLKRYKLTSKVNERKFRIQTKVFGLYKKKAEESNDYLSGGSYKFYVNKRISCFHRNQIAKVSFHEQRQMTNARTDSSSLY